MDTTSDANRVNGRVRPSNCIRAVAWRYAVAVLALSTWTCATTADELLCFYPSNYELEINPIGVDQLPRV